LKDIVSETALNYVSKYPENVDRTFGDWEAEYWFEQRRQERRLRAMTFKGEVGVGEKGISHPLETSPVLGSGSDLPGPNKQVRGYDIEKEDGGHKDTAGRDPSPHSIGGKTGSASHHRIMSSQVAVPIATGNHLNVTTNTGAVPGSAASSPGPLQTAHAQSITSIPGRHDSLEPRPRLAFSLAKFVPLLSERIYVISPFTRSHLVSWITILDSIPDLELVSYLPEFLDGLL
jgi:hypothetical protein